MAGDQGAGGGLSDTPDPDPFPASGERGAESVDLPSRTGRVALIAAVGRNGAIGARGGLPWRLSSDLKRFKALTLGKALIMGRRTFESVGRPLPGRRVIVVTRNVRWDTPGAEVVHDLAEALRLAAPADEIMVGGGGEIYAQALPRASRLYITEVDLAPSADVRFPAIDPRVWREVRREYAERGPKDDADFAFVEYERR